MARNAAVALMIYGKIIGDVTLNGLKRAPHAIAIVLTALLAIALALHVDKQPYRAYPIVSLGGPVNVIIDSPIYGQIAYGHIEIRSGKTDWFNCYPLTENGTNLVGEYKITKTHACYTGPLSGRVIGELRGDDLLLNFSPGMCDANWLIHGRKNGDHYVFKMLETSYGGSAVRFKGSLIISLMDNR